MQQSTYSQFVSLLYRTQSRAKNASINNSFQLTGHESISQMTRWPSISPRQLITVSQLAKYTHMHKNPKGITSFWKWWTAGWGEETRFDAAYASSITWLYLFSWECIMGIQFIMVFCVYVCMCVCVCCLQKVINNLWLVGYEHYYWE